MLRKFNDRVESVVGGILAVLFTGLILTVFLQVMARNVLLIPLVWTLDLAQLLFAWCIFLGAALALRKGQHYQINLWPTSGPVAWVPRLVVVLASGAVLFVLVRNGYAMTLIGLHRESQSLGVSETWFFMPIPLGGGLMLLFFVERLLRGNTL